MNSRWISRQIGCRALKGLSAGRLGPRQGGQALAATALAGVLAAVALLGGCGVRGKPLPPLTPPEIGRGRPTFHRATEDLAFPQVAPVEPVPDAEVRPPARPDDKP